MTHLYILLSETKTRTYTGVAADVEKRLREHNTGKVTSSRPYRPYKIIYTKAFNTLSEARQEERFYKSTTGRRRLKSLITSLEECTVNSSLQPDGSLPSTLL
jgi:putative endonuclease